MGDIYLKSWFSWLWGGVQKALKERRKQTEEKHWKVERKENEEYEESQIIAVYIFGFKLYFARKYDLKNLFKLFMPSNFIYSFYALRDIWSTVIIHQSYIYKIQNCNIIEIYINRLSTTTQIFIAILIWWLDTDGREVHLFEKKEKMFWQGHFFPPHRRNWTMYSRNIFRIMCYLKICTKTCKQFE